jgi:hypothetical protein
MKEFCKKARLLVIGMIAGLTVVGTAAATVTFNTDGTGFVGKGDVQTALGWKNAQFQRNASDITFTYANDLIEVQRCWRYQTGEAVGAWVRYRTVDEDHVETYQALSHGHQISGFVLTGPDPDTYSLHYDPWQGDALPSECFDSNGRLVSVIDENGTGWLTEGLLDPENTISLCVIYGGERVKLATRAG